MAKMLKEQIDSYKFYFGSDDKEIVVKRGKPYPRVGLGGGRAFFSVDSANGILSISCDWGEYVYRGFPGKTETFKELLVRLSRDYLLRKISSPTEINWGKTKRFANKMIVCDRWMSGKEKSEALEWVKDFNPGYDGYEETFCNHFYSYFYEYTDCSVMVKQYPLMACVAVEIFFNYLVPILKKEIEELNSAFE